MGTLKSFINQSLAIRGEKFISVYNISAEKLPWSGKRHILNFSVMAVRDTELRTRVEKKCTYFFIISEQKERAAVFELS